MTESILGEAIQPSYEKAGAMTSVTVNVGLLDTLMNLAGELVLSRNQLLQGVNTANTRATQVSSLRIDLITSELQETIMKTRMQPLASILTGFEGIVRDVSQEQGKSINFKIKDNDVELDKTILESMGQPLAWLVKNSIHHGIETHEQREKAGKEIQGKITLQAFHDSGQVNILISDDGRGQGENIPGDAASRAEMDAVVSTIERLGGSIETTSVPEKGTDIHIRLPLTLAIIPSQIVSVGAERYALPQVNLEELLRIPGDQIREKIEKVGDAAVVRLRGKLLPLLDLAQVLEIGKTYIDPEMDQAQPERRKNITDRRCRRHGITEQGIIETVPDSGPKWKDRHREDRRESRTRAVNVAVVSAGAYKYGLVVDQLHDPEEIVVKPLGRHLKKCRAYVGATIMGDGKVALILDIATLAQLADLTKLSKAVHCVKDSNDMTRMGSTGTSLLTFNHSGRDYFAVPLDLVERIERIRTSAIEMVGNQKIIQYRGGALPLFELSRITPLSRLSERENQEIIVFRVNKRELGLMVSPPVDTIEAILDIDDGSLSQQGILGSIIINGHTTLLIDVPAMAGLFKPEWFADGSNE
ncbi:MAG: chemotaxis protein CheW [Pseudomonadota bacterium]